MRVIGAGLGRTGTKSLQIALQQLGLDPCYHMTELFQHLGHATFWQAAAEGETVAWEEFFAPYQATVDYPGCLFYQELAAHYPAAKVILTLRDPERWATSVQETIAQMPAAVPGWLKRLLPHVGRMYRMIDGLIWQGQFEGRVDDHAYLVARFNAWNEAVQRTVPPERLLIYEVRQGWGPLCAFLDMPLPDVPFPHVNDRATMRRGLRALRLVGVGLPLLAATALVAGLYHWRRR